MQLSLFQTNTFQLVLATNGNTTFVLYLYPDDGIEWGSYAQVGYDAGDHINYYAVPGSMTPSIVDIETTSNVGVPGMYIFQVDTTFTPGIIRLT